MPQYLVKLDDRPGTPWISVGLRRKNQVMWNLCLLGRVCGTGWRMIYVRIIQAAGIMLAMTWCGVADDWPCWRGPGHNGVSTERLELAGGVTRVWSANVGDGYGSMAVWNGRLYVMGGIETVTLYCFDAATGTQNWSFSWSSYRPSCEPGPRCTPAVDGGKVYALCQAGYMYAFDATNGTRIWGPATTGVINVEYDDEYGHCSSPLVWGGAVHLNGGTNGTRVDLVTGVVTGGGRIGACFSVVPTSLGVLTGYWGGESDQKVYLQVGGRVFDWAVDWGCLCSDPLVSGTKMFVSSQEGTRHSGRYDMVSGSSEWLNTDVALYTSQSVLLSNTLCGISSAGDLVGLDWGSGTQVWSRAGFGPGSLIAAENKLIVQAADGTLVILDSSGNELKRLGEVVGSTYTAPVYANGRIYCRDKSGQIVCLETLSDTADNDSDGVPDSWEIRYFGTTNSISGAPDADPDADGMTNYEEYRAGTEPTNRLSLFAVSQVLQSAPTNVVLGWSSVTGKRYRICAASNLLDGFVEMVRTNIAATTPMNTSTVSVGQAGCKFYRIRLE